MSNTLHHYITTTITAIVEKYNANHHYNLYVVMLCCLYDDVRISFFCLKRHVHMYYT